MLHLNRHARLFALSPRHSTFVSHSSHHRQTSRPELVLVRRALYLAGRLVLLVLHTAEERVAHERKRQVDNHARLQPQPFSASFCETESAGWCACDFDDEAFLRRHLPACATTRNSSGSSEGDSFCRIGQDSQSFSESPSGKSTARIRDESVTRCGALTVGGEGWGDEEEGAGDRGLEAAVEPKRLGGAVREVIRADSRGV